jgi:hypothetical protein
MSLSVSRFLNAGIVGGVAILALTCGTQASPVDLLPSGDPISIYLDHFPHGLGSSESKVFLNKADDKHLVTGNVGSKDGSTIVDFHSHALLDATQGFKHGEITGGGYREDSSGFHRLSINVPGYSFGDLLFNVELLEKRDKSDLTIKIFGNDGDSTNVLLDKLHLHGDLDKKGDDLNFLLLANEGAVITRVVLYSRIGFEEFSDFKISDLVALGDAADPPASTPLPGAVWLFGTVLAGAAGFGKWRRRRRAFSAAVVQ